ncbi:MAG: OmpA family protein [Pseudomonadota bacterium]
MRLARAKYWIAPALALAAAACGGARDDAPGAFQAASGVECVPIPEGNYYFDGRYFSPVSGEPVARPASPLDAAINALGLDWLDVRAVGGVAVLMGEAPTAEAKEAALTQAESAVAATTGDFVLDGLTVTDGAAGPGLPVSELDAAPTAAACQNAFAQILAGRRITFRTARDELSARSDRLIDALAGAARLCSAYGLEVGVHTDKRGNANVNRETSQRRADVVRQALIEHGAEAERITARGYGEDRLLEEGDSLRAHRRNRRVEVTVTAP